MVLFLAAGFLGFVAWDLYANPQSILKGAGQADTAERCARVAMEIIGIGVAGLFYFLPLIVADNRKHPNRVGIFLLNLIFGWTLLVWVIALVWACWQPQSTRQDWQASR